MYIRTEYREIQSISPHLIRMRENPNTDSFYAMVDLLDSHYPKVLVNINNYFDTRPLNILRIVLKIVE